MRRSALFATVGVFMGTGVLVLPLAASADPSPGDSPGFNTSPLSPASPGESIQSIGVPPTLTPADVSSPLDKFRYGLQQDFPDIFGGLTTDSNGRYVVEEVGSNASFESEAQQRFDAVPNAMQVTVAPAALQLSFKSVASTLNQLDATKEKVAGQLSTLLQNGVWGVGIDEANNRVLVESTAPSSSQSSHDISAIPRNAIEQSLANTYGGNSLEFRYAEQPATTANRYADTPPWNGGDQLVLPTVFGKSGCTSGPGVHVTSSGGHAVLTAGHCSWAAGINFVGNITAYNTYYPTPVYNSSTTVGLIAISSTGGPTTHWFDTALIPAASSNITWSGFFNRTTFTGNATPPVGGTICSEGSFGLEICGSVIATNVSIVVTAGELAGGSEIVDGLDEMNQPIVSGDSGGTVWENSIFGPLATGTNVASGSDSYSEDLAPILYLYSAYYGSAVVVNTVSNP